MILVIENPYSTSEWIKTGQKGINFYLLFLKLCGFLFILDVAVTHLKGVNGILIMQCCQYLYLIMPKSERYYS